MPLGVPPMFVAVLGWSGGKKGIYADRMCDNLPRFMLA